MNVSSRALACRSECLNGKCLSFLHLRLIASLDDGNGFTAVYLVLQDIVPVKIADGFDGVCFAVDFALVGLHDFLDGGANIGHTHVDTGFLDAGVGSIFYSVNQWVEGGIEVDCERAVDDTPVDVYAEIDFHNVALLQDGLVACVGRVMSGDVVDVETRWKSHARDHSISFFKTLMIRQGAHSILDALGNLRQRHARLDGPLSPLPHCAMDLRAMTILCQKVVVQSIQMALFFAGRAVCIVVLIFDDFAFGEFLVGEDVDQRDAGRIRLYARDVLLLLGLALLLFLGR